MVDVGGRILHGVVEQLPERETEQLAIGVHQQAGRHAFDDRMAVQTRVELSAASRDKVGDDVAIAVDDEVAGVDPQHLHGIGHERLEPIEVLVDDRRQLAVAAHRPECWRADRWPRPSST